MIDPYSIFIGFDSRETEAYNVAQYSIVRRTRSPVLISPIALKHLDCLLTRPIERKDGKLWCPISQAPMATEFAISRFCVPFIQLKGWALFCDCDVLCLSDIAEIFDLADDKYAVMVVKHDYVPKEQIKMDGQMQTHYRRKNWSSVVLWNCSHPGNKRLKHTDLNGWPGRDLHAFKWLKDDEIGELPVSWNWLVGVTEGTGDVGMNLLHYTLGTPNMHDNGEPFNTLWNDERKLMLTKDTVDKVGIDDIHEVLLPT